MSDPGALTAADIARLAGVTRATVSNWRRRHADFPEPSGGTDASPAYDRNEVEAWLAARGALPELPVHERLWRRVQDAADGADLGETVSWAARELAAACGTGGEILKAQPLGPAVRRSEDDGGRAGKSAALSRELADAAHVRDPADVLDSLITRYAEASSGRVSVTARPVADLMAAIAGPGRGTVLDPACGTGELLAAAARQGAAKLFGQELDASLAELTSIRLSISRGVRDSAVSAGDSLRNDKFPDLVADAVLCHPPFGDRDWGQEELVLDARWEYGTPPKAEPELAWAQHALAHLRPGGRAVLVMPPAAAGRPSGRRIRAEMLRRGAIKAVIALDPGAIYPRHVGPHLWVLERPRDTSLEPRVLLMDSAGQDTILTAWRAFSARDAAGGSEPGAWRIMPAIDLLDESVDLTPSRHVGIRATESSPAEAAEAVGASRARLRAALEALSRALPGAEWVPPDRGLRWREVSIGDLENSGTLQVHRTSPANRAAGEVRIRRGDVLLPVTAAGPVNVRVATEEDDGALLGRGLYLIRPDQERIDPWFLAGFLGSPGSLQQAKYGTSSMRIDARRLTVPLLPLPEQQRYATAFRRLRDFSAAATELADRARDLTELLGDSLTQGALIPGNDSEKLAMPTFCGRFASNTERLYRDTTEKAVMSGTDVIAGRFEVLGPQARGNMGEVYRARDLETGETVAVKVIRRRRSGEEVSLTDADKNAARFEREVRIMARLSSPNLPRTIAGGLDGDRPYLAMEFIDGVTLSSLLDEEERLPVSWAAAIGAQIAQGLDAAHMAGVVHRDLKPSNVMLDASGFVNVLDFGVGLILDDVDGGSRLTSSDVTVGTARYMAPEQATRQGVVTGAVDLYALGCVLYEMLTGAPPFDGDTIYEMLNQHVGQQPLPVSELRGEVPAELDAVITRLLEKDPANRPGTAAEVVELLMPFALLPGPGVPGAPGDPVLSLAGRATAGDVGRRDVGDIGADRGAAAPTHADEPVPAEDGGFDIFAVHQRLIGDYRAFTEGSAVIRDDRIAKFMDEDLDAKSQWPDPWLSLNPFFADGGSVTDLVDAGYLHPECAKIFQTGKTEGGTSCDGQPIRFYRHQREAIRAAQGGDSYVLTTGTGSGKSLSYIVPIVDRVLRARTQGDRSKRVRAIIVYPMNALANSQLKELEKFLRDGFPAGQEPVTFARYTGQESQADRDRIRNNPPDILLTNYVMLELMLTRPADRQTLIHMAEGLEFLVFDELHTYRGRQGADVAMLIRRVKDACAADNVQCVGTSATMSTEGTSEERRRVVAGVASEIFGAPVAEENVIGETLVRATGEDPGPVTRQRIAAPVAPAAYSDLVRDPLASWIETTFGLDRDDEGSLARRKPATVAAAARELAAATGAGEAQCEKALQKTLQAGSRAEDPASGRPLFAFRLHQFLSKGDTVYVTLEDENTRHITRDYQVEQPGSGGKILLPLAFCRECGQEYLAVWRQEKAGSVVYKARRDASMAGGDEGDGQRVLDGYLYISGDLPWPRDLATVIADRRVPEGWLEVNDRTGEDVIKPTARKYLPGPVTVDVHGYEHPDAGGIEAAFLPAPFRFCLRCGVSYEQVRGNDFAKLATLDAEGRSSATSLTSMSIVRSLRAVPAGYLGDDARKLLTFVDNRQDAALQAGHFNDFVQVTMIRGALHAAAARAVADGEEGLYYDEIPTKVTRALSLSPQDYAKEPGEDPALRRRTDKALHDVVNLRVYLDLERGWRVTMPNLEQTGLLEIGYLGLEGIAANNELWRDTFPALRDAAPATRAQISRVLLDEMRRSLAIDADCFDPDEFDRIRRGSDGRLRPEWAVTDADERPAAIVFPQPSRPGTAREMVYMSGRGKFGRYLKRAGRFPGYLPVITSGDAQEIIEDLMGVLAGGNAGLLARTENPRKKGAFGYRVRATAMVWRPGDGTHGAGDPLSRTFSGAGKPRVNQYFVRLYRDVAATLSGLVAREHTAQVAPEVREEREEDFRKGELKLLYCSPTMELGVDIAGLNAVSMRNVPPTPANYAQRSGRAGRSGQPALVTTYCATGNSHDQYYFRNSDKMVAGVVTPPKLDLLNEDLLRSHVHATWIAEAGLKLGRAIPESIDMEGTEPEGRHRPDPRLRLIGALEEQIHDPGAAHRAATRAKTVLAELQDDLRDKTSWWDPDWVDHVIKAAPATFDHAFDRWRELFRAALIDQWEQNRRRMDYSLTERDRDIARKRRHEAETQLKLLRNEDSDDRNITADFNPYRYLASEGFLPGYSFPRLPIAAYIPGGRGVRSEGDYVQRARFLAIREFGPRALIYHEGARYEVHRVQLQPDASGDVIPEQSHRCQSCGYHHEVAPGNDRCELCGTGFTGKLTGLLALHTVFTRQRQRITSDEEERRRAGFRVVTSYRFQDHGDRPGRLDSLTHDHEGQQVARLVYGDSAIVRRINLGPARRPEGEPDGFWLDPVTGNWLTSAQADGSKGAGNDDEDTPANRRIRVIPYVQDRRNILVLQLAAPVEAETAVSVMFALERGIEATFQLEDAELDSELLPPDDGPRDRILFTESAEGGAGVLRRLQAESDALGKAATEALRIAHFDPDTGADRGGVDGHPCGKGCYNCLLSYGNQLVHDMIDRHRARHLLLAIAKGSTVSAGRGTSRTEDAIRLISQADSSLEEDFIAWLKEHGYRLPTAAQETVDGAYAKPDFIYRRADGPVAVFVDGPVHDEEPVAQRDAAAEERLEDLGWFVIRVRHDAHWQDVVRRYPRVFGEGR